MRYQYGVIGVAVSILLTFSAVVWAQSAGDWLEKGIEYSSKEEYEKALECDTKAIELAPEWAQAYYYRAIDYKDAGRYDDAIGDYTKAIELDPEFRDAYFNRGIASDDMGRYTDAIGDYTKAIELDPEFVLAYNNRGWTFYLMSDYEKALEDVTCAIGRVDADETYVLSGILDTRANIYREMGRYDEAMADIVWAIELEVNFTFYYTRGLIYRNMENMDRARADFEHACKNGIDEACDVLDELR